MWVAEKGGQEMEEKELDYVLVPLGLVVFGMYYVWLLFSILRHPARTVVGLNAESRHQWVFSMMSVRPPKALDEDETGFLDKLESVRVSPAGRDEIGSAIILVSSQAAVASQSTIVHEVTETPPVSKVQEIDLAGRKNPPACPFGTTIIKAKPQAKKAKKDVDNLEESLDVSLDAVKSPSVDTGKQLALVKSPNDDADKPHVVADTGLVSYSDYSEED
ncbi:hypothetical protein RHSIM_Rhsim12G0140700 [Rhododendron simsii]|uniref:Uncharacterized protein n=1 Tax=Rhododendron simsii TaxID=118357 RepID=A0A834G4Z5_RHOSS|nr:hypothetical protein RHSIM_Rhsim12G0140700 [Rhododendron simsii]